MAENCREVGKWEKIFRFADDSCSNAYKIIDLNCQNYSIAEQKFATICKNMADLRRLINLIFQRAVERLSKIHSRSQLTYQELLCDAKDGEVSEDEFRKEMEKLANISFDLNEPVIADIDSLIEQYRTLRLQVEEIFTPTAILVDIGTDEDSEMRNNAGRSTISTLSSSYVEQYPISNDAGHSFLISARSSSFVEQYPTSNDARTESEDVENPFETSFNRQTRHAHFELTPHIIADVNPYRFLVSPVEEPVRTANFLQRVKTISHNAFVIVQSDNSIVNLHPELNATVKSDVTEMPIASASVELVDQKNFTPVDLNRHERHVRAVRAAGLLSIRTTNKSKLTGEFD